MAYYNYLVSFTALMWDQSQAIAIIILLISSMDKNSETDLMMRKYLNRGNILSYITT